MKVLITGVAGNLGKILAGYLLQKNISVVGIDNAEYSGIIQHPHFTFYHCCITEKRLLRCIFTREQPTHIVHFAATFNHERNLKKEWVTDVGGSKNVLEVANQTSSVKQLIYSSSAAAYGGHPDNRLWLTEENDLRPGKYRYGIIKKKVEEEYLKTRVRDDLKVVCLRISTVIGPSFTKKRSAVSILINSKFALKHWKTNKVQFLHEEDMNAVLFRVLNDPEISGSFNLAPDTYAEVDLLVPGKKYVFVPIPVILFFLWILWNLRILNLRPASIFQSLFPIVLSPRKLASRYEYHFRYSTEEAFRATLRNFVHQPEPVNMVPGQL